MTTKLSPVALLAALAVLLSPGVAHAQRSPRPVPAPPPPAAPTPAASPVGPLDVTRLEIDPALDPAVPRLVGAIADIAVTETIKADEVAIAIRPAGGAGDGTLDLPHTGPRILYTWQPIQLGGERTLPPGRYEAHVAVHVGDTWIHDERVTSFEVS
jgi:hypothetical protein